MMALADLAAPALSGDQVHTMDELVVFLQRFETLHGLKCWEITDIESRIGQPLPKVYTQFLTIMGRGGGDYMRGSSAFYEELSSLQEGGEELMAENGLPPLPDNCFVFWMHQGYQLAIFYLNDGDDPPVYYYCEGYGQKGFELISYSLTDFFVYQLADTYPERKIMIPDMPPSPIRRRD
ncbi:SMI1/KNR4 family protein [Paraflavitalea pollutisoli]|uniref:SMI1/KNR4 family protein n=1 Tax=Paraflavitalea pollutisoli TaxID=3034143 RepID=UPI0023EAC4C4|nr:SMI1/KNR4 family protein [Paraflavitalea sp. H1-2-19X]